MPGQDREPTPKLLKNLDLTNRVERISQIPVDSGQYADIWMGELATDPSIKKVVALKLLRGRGSLQKKWAEGVCKRYVASIEVWCQLEHAHVAPVYGLVFDLGTLPALVMSYYSAGNVMHLLSHDPGTSMETRLSLIRDVSSGLQYLHEFSPPVIHGDIRAANIFVDDTGRACLADYGMPFIMDDPLWSHFKGVGPCRWTAPEVMDPPDDEPLSRLLYTQSSDVYSFGMTMLEILTGKAPFERKDHDLKVYTFVAAGNRPDIPSFIPKDISALIQKCWAQNPAHRPSAGEVSRTLNSSTLAPSMTSVIWVYMCAVFRTFFGEHSLLSHWMNGLRL